MAHTLTVREVPSSVHRELTARAARRGQSLQEYVLGELVRITSKPALEELLTEVAARKQATGTTLDAETILELRDADRR